MKSFIQSAPDRKLEFPSKTFTSGIVVGVVHLPLHELGRFRNFARIFPPDFLARFRNERKRNQFWELLFPEPEGGEGPEGCRFRTEQSVLNVMKLFAAVSHDVS